MVLAQRLSRRNDGRHGGYALIAALIAVALVSLATLMAVEPAQTDARRERERELLFVGEQYRSALMSYFAIRAAGGQQFPKTLDDLVEDKRQLVTVRHLRRIYRDPMTNEADWVLEKQGDRIVGVHSRSMEAPLKHAGFPAAEHGFAEAKTYAAWRFLALADNSSAPAQALPASSAGNSDPGAASATAGGQPSSPAPNIDQVFNANQCFQEYVLPRSDCAVVPPEYGHDQASCVRTLQALYTACIASASSPNN